MQRVKREYGMLLTNCSVPIGHWLFLSRVLLRNKLAVWTPRHQRLRSLLTVFLSIAKADLRLRRPHLLMLHSRSIESSSPSYESVCLLHRLGLWNRMIGESDMHANHFKPCSMRTLNSYSILIQWLRRKIVSQQVLSRRVQVP